MLHLIETLYVFYLPRKCNKTLCKLMKMLTVHLNTPPKETNLHPPPWKKRKEKKNKQTNKEVEGDSLDGIYLWISLLLLFSSLSASPTSLHLLPIEYKKNIHNRTFHVRNTKHQSELAITHNHLLFNWCYRLRHFNCKPVLCSYSVRGGGSGITFESYAIVY